MPAVLSQRCPECLLMPDPPELSSAKRGLIEALLGGGLRSEPQTRYCSAFRRESGTPVPGARTGLAAWIDDTGRHSGL